MIYDSQDEKFDSSFPFLKKNNNLTAYTEYKKFFHLFFFKIKKIIGVQRTLDFINLLC